MPPGAFSIATGDFNHDGKLDIAVRDDNGLAVALGNGDGTFQKAVSYSAELSYSIAVADFNGDGNLDIVTANLNLNPSTVSVYLGNGDGTFQPLKDSNTTTGSTFVVVGDFNHDNIPDLLIWDSPYVSVLLGKGDGTFQPPNDTLGFPAFVYGAVVGDFNNDHKLDALVVGQNGNSYLGVLLGNGDGTLQPVQTYSLEFLPQAVAAGDFNQDGNLDIAIGDKLADVTVMLGNGDGTSQAGVTYNTLGLSGIPLVAADLNLDGRLDLVVPGGPSAGVDVFWGNGDGTFAPAQFFPSGQSGILALGDFNGDRLPDVVLAGKFSGATTILNTGVVSFSTSAPFVFPDQLIKTSSTARAVELTNTGTAVLSIISISVNGQFNLSSNTTCGGNIPPGAGCSVGVTFKPLTMGPKRGTVSIADSASSKPQVIELSGQGTVVAVSPSSISFPSQKVGTKSTPMAVTIKNDGSASLTITTISIGGTNLKDFSQTNNCPTNGLAAGASCTITVTFDPAKTGTRRAHIAVIDNGGGSPQTVPLTGTGT